MRLLKLVPDDTNIKFLKWRLPFYVVSCLLIAASWGLVLTKGLNYGVDFAGGQEVRLTFEQRKEAPIPALRELVGGLNKLIAYAQLTGQEVSLQLAEEQLTDILSANRRRITIDEIQRTVCHFYRIDRSEMSSKRRARAVVRPRQVAMYLSKVLTPRSYPEIGRKFGGRDHSTVIHAVRLIEDLRQRDADMDGDVRSLLRQLES